MGYQGNIYRVHDQATAAKTIQACIIAHTFASRFDKASDLAELLLPSFPEDEVEEIVRSVEQAETGAQEATRARRQANQREYERTTAAAAEGMSQRAISRQRSALALDLREEMFQALFCSTHRPEEDTNALSRRYEKTIQDFNRINRATGGLAGGVQQP